MVLMLNTLREYTQPTTKSYRWIAIWLAGAVVIAVATLALLLNKRPDPVPAAIKDQLNFHAVYPQELAASPASWKYSRSDQILTFSVKGPGFLAVFTEQPTPLAYRDDRAAYDRFIGSLRP